MIDHTLQLKKLQETIKKNQETITQNQNNFKPEKEDPLKVQKLNEDEFV